MDSNSVNSDVLQSDLFDDVTRKSLANIFVSNYASAVVWSISNYAKSSKKLSVLYNAVEFNGI